MADRSTIVLRRLPGGAVHPGDLRCSPGMSRWNTSASSRLEPSMTSIAIIGAGPGLGAATARRFGAEGFTVGLISRHQGHLDALAEELANDGIQAKGFTADVRDPSSIASQNLLCKRGLLTTSCIPPAPAISA